MYRQSAGMPLVYRQSSIYPDSTGQLQSDARHVGSVTKQAGVRERRQRASLLAQRPPGSDYESGDHEMLQ